MIYLRDSVTYQPQVWELNKDNTPKDEGAFLKALQVLARMKEVREYAPPLFTSNERLGQHAGLLRDPSGCWLKGTARTAQWRLDVP